SGAASFSVLIGAVARLLPPQHRGTAAGIINAGGSFGQFIFAPLLQTLIVVLGWMGAMWSIAVIALAALPLARVLRGSQSSVSTTIATPGDGGLRAAVKRALADRSYLLLHAGFFTCGFHIAFLVTHLPGEVDLCGLPASVASWSLAIIGLANIFGSLAAGWSVNHYRSKYVLFWMYGSRALLVLLYLLAPKSVWTFYLFAAGLGFTWLATCAAHRRCGRQTVWDALSRDLVWANSSVAPDWGFFRRVARGDCDHPLRQLPVDVVCGCFVGYHSRLMQSTDSRTGNCAPRSARLIGLRRLGRDLN